MLLFRTKQREIRMAEPKNGYEFLKQLAEKKDSVQSPYQEFNTYLDSKARKTAPWLQ